MNEHASRSVSVLRWEEPPPKTRDKWAIVVKELQERAGEWGLVAEDVEPPYAEGTIAQSLRKKGCQVSQRRRGSTVSVWARWPNGQ